MARPTKLMEPIAKQIELAVRDGASYRVAAKHAGVSERTFHRWMTRGQDEQERIEAAEAREASERSCCPRRAEKSFWQFWQRIEQADAEAQVRAAAQISAAAAKDWRAAAWLLERRDPATFGPPQARLGLVVERADPGSLDLALGLGGLYQAVTSQPLSFALNLAALVGYAEASIRAIDPRRRDRTGEIRVQLPVVPHADHEEYHPGEIIPTTTWHPPRGTAAATIPSDYTSVRMRVTSQDGTSIEIDCSK